MGIDRRGFMKIAGLAGLGAVARPALEMLINRAEAGDGNTWLMVIDLRECLKHPHCNDCQKACHAAHNVPDLSSEPAERQVKEEIKWIWKHPFAGAFPEQFSEHVEEYLHTYLPEEQKKGTSHVEVPILCNHCANPPCVRVCPTQATFKNETNGIVMMDMHRCIGCRFCMAACPYGSRSFNWSDPKKWIKPMMIVEDPGDTNLQQGDFVLQSQFTGANNGISTANTKIAKNKAKLRPAVGRPVEFPRRSKGVVEKCNFCADTLEGYNSKGLVNTPECVSACKHKAIHFGRLGDMESHKVLLKLLHENYSIRRKSGLGTEPQVYYVL